MNAQIMKLIGKGAVEEAKFAFQLFLNDLQAGLAIVLADMQLGHNNMLNQIKLQSDFAKTSYEIALKRLDQGMQTSMDTLQSAVNAVGKSVSDTAFDMAKTIRNRVESNLKQNVEIQYQEQTLKLRQELDKVSYELTQNIDNLKSLKARNDYGINELNKVIAAVSQEKKNGDSFQIKITDIVSEASIKILETEKGLTDAIRQEFKENYEKQLEFEKNLALKRIEYETKLMDIRLGLAERVNKEFLNIEKTATSIGYSMGIAVGAADKFHLGITNAAHAVAELNKSVEDIMKLQTAWATNTGRTSGLSESDMKNVFAIGNLSDQGSVETIIGAANLFNKSATQTSQIVFKSYQMANKMGLSGQKVVKDIAKNMELINKMNFRNGIDGMMQMAVWAEKVRFDMGKLDSMIGKTVDGGLEGLVSQSAKFNVLGGAAAAMSDPFGMAFDALSDPDAFAKRMVSMTEGMGMWNSRTGKVDFTMEETLRMRQIAALQGQSYEDLAKQVQEREKRARVDKLIGGRYGEGADAVASHAFFDEKSQRWMVNVMGENGQYAKKDITQLSQADINSLSPAVEPLEDLVNIARKLLSIQEKQEAEGRGQLTSMVINSRTDLKSANNTLLTKSHEDYEKHKDDYKELIIQGLNDALAVQQSVYDSYIAEKAAIEKQLEIDAQALILSQGVKDMHTDFNTQIKSYTDTLAEANRVMTDILDKLRPYAHMDSGAYSQTVTNEGRKHYNEEGGKERAKKAQDVSPELIDSPVMGDIAEFLAGAPQLVSKFMNKVDPKTWWRTLVKKDSDAWTVWYNRIGDRNETPVSGEGFTSETPPASVLNNPKIKNVQRVNDFLYSGSSATIIADNRTYRTHPDDVITAAKSGGVVDRLTERDGLNSLNNGKVTLEIKGDLILRGENGEGVSIMEDLRRNPVLLHNLTEMIFTNRSTNRVSNVINV